MESIEIGALGKFPIARRACQLDRSGSISKARYLVVTILEESL